MDYSQSCNARTNSETNEMKIIFSLNNKTGVCLLINFFSAKKSAFTYDLHCHYEDKQLHHHLITLNYLRFHQLVPPTQLSQPFAIVLSKKFVFIFI